MYQDLEPIAFKKALAESTDAILVDVRTPAEIAESNIEGHIAINLMDPTFPQKILELDQSKPIFIYCRSGNRSGQACKFLASKGYTQLTNLKGGMLAWNDDF